MSDDALQTADGSAPAPFPNLWLGSLTLALLVAAFLVSYLDRHLLALMVAPVRADLRIDDFQISLLVGVAFSLFYAVFGIPTGRLADQFSRKWLIVAGIILWSLATMSSGLATSFGTLFICRIAVGVGEAVLGPASYSMLGDLFPPKRLVRATSVLSLAATLSAGLALIVGGQVFSFATNARSLPFGLMDFAPWQRAFILTGLPGFAMVLLFLVVREPVRRGGATESERVEGRVFGYLWSNRGLYFPIHLCAAGMAAMLAGGLSWFPTHLIRVFGETPAHAGLIIGTVQIVGAIIGTIVGLVMIETFLKRGYSDGPLRTVMVTALVSAMLAAALFVPSENATIALWLVAVIFQNTYYGNVVAALQISTPSRARGTNIAVLYLTINVIGVGVGTALIGAISNYLFPGNPRGIGYGLAAVGGIGALLASYSARRGLPRYRRALALLGDGVGG